MDNIVNITLDTEYITDKFCTVTETINSIKVKKMME